MVPILASIILGQKQPVSMRRSLLLSSTYVLGSAMTYALAGVAAALMGSSLQAWLQQPWIIACVSGIMALLALSLFGVYDLQLPRAFQNRIAAITQKQKGGTYLGVFVMGAVSVLIVSPCVTAPLAGVLMYIAQTGNVVLGAGALFAMGIGMGVPLILLGISAGRWLPRRGAWMGVLQKSVGVMMLVLAVWLLSRVVAMRVIVQMCGLLLIATALYWAALRAGHKIKYLGIGAMGALLIVMASVPAVSGMFVNAAPITKSQPFVIVRNLQELDRQLTTAKTLNKPVLLDFYADWCESCVAMDKNVFTVPYVMQSLNPFILLRADLSANTAEEEALLKNYGVIAPPTILFFNNQGKEVNSQRIVGELSAQEFLTRIHTFITASCDKNITC
jgi:thiol:disulfide interchange protein DsbD